MFNWRIHCGFRKSAFVLLSLLFLSTAGILAYRHWIVQDEQPPLAKLAALHRAYQLSDSRIVWFTTSASRESLRYCFMSGETGIVALQNAIDQMELRFQGNPGWECREPATVQVSFKDSGKEIWWNQSGVQLTGQQIAAQVTETEFSGAGVTLKGRLVMPDSELPVPIAVLVHGSESTSAIWNSRFQFMFPAHGVGVFVYDKRGTGGSSGNYTQDFHLLAEDAAAAWREAKRMSSGRSTEIGYCGGSQAGWIIPLAAQLSQPDFLSINYGLAEGPLAEDRDEVQTELRSLGYGQQVLAQAREVTDATAQVMTSGFSEGFDQVAQVRKKYSSEEWYARVQGEFTGDILRYPGWLVRTVGPWRDVGTTWNYDPLPALQSLRIPTLWILGGKDREAPSQNTFAILQSLQATVPHLDIAMFPNADHGMIEYNREDDSPSSPLVPTRFSEGYFPMLIDWIKLRKTRCDVEDVQLRLDESIPSQ